MVSQTPAIMTALLVTDETSEGSAPRYWLSFS